MCFLKWFTQLECRHQKSVVKTKTTKPAVSSKGGASIIGQFDIVSLENNIHEHIKLINLDCKYLKNKRRKIYIGRSQRTPAPPPQQNNSAY